MRGALDLLDRSSKRGFVQAKVFLLLAITSLGFATLLESKPIITAEVVGELPPMMSPSDPNAFSASEDGKHYAFIRDSGSRQQMIVNGVASELYTRISPVQIELFTRAYDSMHSEVTSFYHREYVPVLFTGQGDEFIYSGERDGKIYTVVFRDGQHHEWPSIGQLQVIGLSPKGKYIYSISRNQVERKKTMELVLNGKHEEGVGIRDWRPNSLAFHEPSEGPSHIAYVSRTPLVPGKRSSERVMVDGVSGPDYASVLTRDYPLSFVTIDGKLAVTYLANDNERKGQKAIIQFLDGTVIESEAGVIMKSFRVSEDKSTVAWLHTPVAERNAAHVQNPPPVAAKVVFNGEEVFSLDITKGEDRVLGSVFQLSPDGSRWSLKRGIVGGNQGQHFLVDGVPEQVYPFVEKSFFGAGAQPYVYITRNDRGQFIVMNGVEYGPYSSIGDCVFSDSGQSFGWQAVNDSGSFIYVNGAPVRSYEVGGSRIPLSFCEGTEDVLALVNKPDQSLILIVGNDEYDANGKQATDPIFSVDGNRVAMNGDFSAHDGHPASYLMLNGNPLKMDTTKVMVDRTYWKGFTPDGKHFLTFANIQVDKPEYRQAGTLLIDGQHLEDLYLYAGSDARGHHFSEDGRFGFYGVRDKEIIRFTVDVEAASGFVEDRKSQAEKSAGQLLFKADNPKTVSSWTDIRVHDGNVIYGVANGGEYGMGVIYRINTDGTGFQVIHDFLGGGDHARLPSSLVLGKDGFLYGSTGQGSFSMRQPQLAGGLFRLRTDGSDYKVIKTYEYSAFFRSGPILRTVASDGRLVASGVAPDSGNFPIPGVVTIDPATGDLQKMPSLVDYIASPEAKMYPVREFINGDDGYFYSWDTGKVFRFKIDGSEPELLHEFKGFPLDGTMVRNAPLLYGDWLYGRTLGGGKNRMGTVYRMKRDGSDYEVLLHIDQATQLFGLVAGDVGVFGYRYTAQRVNNRNVNVPVIQRFDIDGSEPQVLDKAKLGGTVWVGKFGGEPALYSAGTDELSVLGLSTMDTSAPELTMEMIPMKPIQ